MRDNRRIRVFVSSTFRDMVEERNELMTQTWPELRRFCRERLVELIEVDLRWGIAEEQSTRKETLKLCLDEIRSCRPFFIVLLGERYGWDRPWMCRDRCGSQEGSVFGASRCHASRPLSCRKCPRGQFGRKMRTTRTRRRSPNLPIVYDLLME